MTRLTTAPNLDSGFVSRSHRAITPFELHRPTRAADAAALMANGALPHAGGIDLVSSLRRGTRATGIVDLGRIEELKRLETVGDDLVVGAGVNHAAIETNEQILSARPDLAAAWQTVGNVRIRRSGTIGGNLMAFRPEYDAAPILAAADTRLVFLAPDGSELITTVAERPNGLLFLRAEIPMSGRVMFDRSLKPAVTVAVGDNTIAIGCAHSDLVVLSRSESLDIPRPLDDAHASSEYRQRVIEVLVARNSSRHQEVRGG